MEFDTVQGEAPSIIHVSGDIYAIAYSGGGNDGFGLTIALSLLSASERKSGVCGYG